MILLATLINKTQVLIKCQCTNRRKGKLVIVLITRRDSRKIFIGNCNSTTKLVMKETIKNTLMNHPIMKNQELKDLKMKKTIEI